MSGFLGRSPSSPVHDASLPTGTAPYGRDKWGRRRPKPYDRTGAKNPRWKGGRRYFQGYYLVYRPGHPFANRNYILEHRDIMERQLGRYLQTDEIVHHKNGQKSDNRLENLELMTNGTHAHYHHLGNSYNPPKISGHIAEHIRFLYFTNPKRNRKQKHGNRLTAIQLAKRFRCARTTILDILHYQGAYAHHPSD